MILLLTTFLSGNFLIAQENNPYDEYGLEHNRALEYFYKELRDMDYKQYNAKESQMLVLKIVNTYFTEVSTLRNETGMPKDVSSFLEDIIKFPPPLSPTFPEAKDNESVSNELMSKSRVIFDFTSNGNSTALKSNVDIIMKSEFNENEKTYLLVINSIGYNSLRYWKENSSKWMNLSHDNLETKSAPPWARIGAADVGGGIVGALAGASVSFGVLTLPGWVVGAAGTSLVQGCVELVDWLW